MPYKDLDKKREKQRKRMQEWREKHPEDNRARCKASYEKHREERLDKTREWKNKNPEVARASALLSAAKKRRKECFDLDVHEIANILKEGVCQVTGIPFVLSTKKPHPFSPSLDRIDSSKGYTKENTRVVVWMYNCCKNEFSDEDVLNFLKLSAEKIVPTVATALKGK